MASTLDRKKRSLVRRHRQGVLKKETEGLILAAQDQAFRTNAIKARIDKSQTDSICRVCKKLMRQLMI